MKSISLPLVAGLLCGVALAAPGASPFADKYAASYSSYKDLRGQEVDPLWGSLKPDDFGSRTVPFDQSGVRSVSQVPGPGVHPRIFFTAADLPDIRRRLKETQCGQAAWKNLLCWTTMMKGQYDDTADYAKPDVWKGGFGGLHGRVPLFRLGVPRAKGAAYNHNPGAAQAYQSLVAGTATDFPPFYWNVFSLEAFRVLVDEDRPGALDLAKAVVTALRIDQARRDAAQAAKRVAGPPDQPVGGFQLAFVYDLLYNYLNPEQRRAIHDELALSTWHHDNYGTFNTATSSRSNWATFSYWLFEVLGIEDEPGFNELKVRGMYRGWRDLLTYGWFQSGATYEGEAKNQLGMDGIIPFAMRAKRYGFENLVGHPYLRAYETRFLPLSVIPTLDGFVKYDLLGGAHGFPMAPECLGLKYMLPNDRVADWIYRCAVGEHYENVPDRCDGYRNDLLFFLVFASDFDPANNDPASLNLGNTFFCGERALMMTRSGWDRDALMLNMHTREANGGHPFADRNAIMVAGAGRVWSPPGYASFKTAENSVVCIDGSSQLVNTPGHMVAFADSPLATFAVGDASYPWNWKWRTLDKPGGYYTVPDARAGRVKVPPGWEAERHTTNDFSFLKLPYAYLNAPMFENPHWILPDGAIGPVVRQPNYPVKLALRAAGLVRGPHPYALVVDDIQKDDAPHQYDWTLALEPDIQIARIEKTGPSTMDIYLTGMDPRHILPAPAGHAMVPPTLSAGAAIAAGQPMLLVRVLSRETSSDSPGNPSIVELPNQTDAKKYGAIRRLVIPATAVAPGFKVLLFAYRQGAALPATTYASGRLTVAWPDQSDDIRLSSAAPGGTGIRIARAGTVLLDLEPDFKPLD